MSSETGGSFCSSGQSGWVARASGEKPDGGGATGPHDARRRVGREAGLPLLVISVAVIVLLVVAGAAGVLDQAGSPPSRAVSASQSQALEPGRGVPDSLEAGCNYTISMNESTPVALASSGAETVGPTGTDVGVFLDSLLTSHETLCFAAGLYQVGTQIQVYHLQGVTLKLDPAAVIQATSGNRLLLVTSSPDTVVTGGQWVGSARTKVSVITLQYGSNNSVVERTDVSRGGANGILVYDNVRPDFNVSILDNSVHDNSRFGIQAFSNTSAGMTGTLISGNVAVDNVVGGIYTNAVSGVRIADNVVRNTVGNGPGEIGIGVTNGYNDTVTENQVDHMAWFGIQAYYNNYTLISDNISTFNSGGEDESGITNDHSSHNTIVDNVVDSNGKTGVYIERSWDVVVRGNVADGNLGYGISLYHGNLPVMGRVSILGNTCSFNSLGGIILNSAIDDVISMNECYNNSGDGILLYNDLGQAGSRGNLISYNWLGNEHGSPMTQTFGIGEGNNSDNNTLVSNVLVNNTVSAVSLVGSDALASP